MKWRICVALTCFALIGAASALPRGAPQLEVIGDGAPGLQPALGAQVDGAHGQMSVVLLRRPESLRHLPDVARLCRGRCEGGLTVLWELRLTGARRVVAVDLRAFPDGAAALDAGGALPADVVTCLAKAIGGQWAALWVVPADPCLPRQRWAVVLPYGL